VEVHSSEWKFLLSKTAQLCAEWMISNATSPPIVDVVVPVYLGAAVTRRCLESVLGFEQAVQIELVVIDDASPDSELVRYVDSLAASGRITLIRNESNKGFVHSVNCGIALHSDRDVVLLNSDAEVSNDWLDRLRRCARSADDVGTVTPFSNNATICSYPYEGWSAGVPGTLGLAALDGLFARVNNGQSVAIPTAVGFCMYISRTCLDQIGAFDAQRFGLGYGEENDFCLRASSAGWRHLLAADVFVFHMGGGSFSTRRFKLQETALAALLDIYPDYLQRIATFQAENSVAPLRLAIDCARMATNSEEQRHVLFEQVNRGNPTAAMKPVRLHITHGWGGGTARWVGDYCRADGTSRNLVLRSQSDRNRTGRWLELIDSSAEEVRLMHWELTAPIDATAIRHPQYLAVLESIVDAFGVSAIIISSLIGHSVEALDTKLPTIVVWHDLYPFCPALFACFDTQCECCPSERLASCLSENPYNRFWHNSVVADWLALRAAYAGSVGKSWVRIVAPTRDVWNRWSRLLPPVRELPWHLIGHGIEECSGARVRRHDTPAHERLRIVVPGRLNPHKGLHLLAAALADILQYAEVLLLGCGEFGKPFAAISGIQIVENYRQQDLAECVSRFDPDAALLLSVLPESFSYTLSELWALGIPVAATRLGAFVERIDDGVTGLLFDPEPSALVECVRNMATDREMLSRLRGGVASAPVRGLNAMINDYHLLLPETGAYVPSLADQGLILAARERQALEQKTASLQAVLATRDEQLAHLRSRVTDLTNDLVSRTRFCDSLLRSRSWKATAPIRAVAAQVRGWWGHHRRQAPVEVDADSCAIVPPIGNAVVSGTEDGNPRRYLRKALDIPDNSVVILANASLASTVDAGNLIRLANASVLSRNDVVVWVPKGNPNDGVWDNFRHEVAAMVAAGRLFFGDRNLAAEIWPHAVDGVLQNGDGEAVVDPKMTTCVADS
jgi:GT2 family glycosyltransferase/glycosyltransferase involved in cell wall biosynthesis